MILASAGARGLTHRAVDRHLGIPEGSTGSHYGTRAELVRATADRIAELNLRSVRALELKATSRAEAARRIAALPEEAIAAPERQLARYALTVEAAHHPELRRASMEVRDLTVEQGVRLLREVGCRDPERGGRALVILIDGEVFDRVMFRSDAVISQEEFVGDIERLLGAY